MLKTITVIVAPETLNNFSASDINMENINWKSSLNFVIGKNSSMAP